MSVSVKHWQDPINLILGLWMVVSPWGLSYQAEMHPTWNAVIVGALIVVLALFEFVKLMTWEEWTDVALGVWLVISPWVLGFSGMTVVRSNALAVGAVVALLALWVLVKDKKIGGGGLSPAM